MQRLFTFMLICALLIVPALASAHAELVSSDPADGAVLDVAPSSVTLKFDDELASEGAKLVVTAADGSSADAGNGGVDLSDAEHKTMTVDLKPNLGPGTYTVTWSVVGDDGHEVGSSISFEVKGAADSAPASQPSSAESAAPATANLPSTGGTGSISWMLICGAVLILGCGLLIRRRVSA